MLNKEIFKKEIAYLQDLWQVVSVINRLHNKNDNEVLYAHSAKISNADYNADYQFIYNNRDDNHWELNKYYYSDDSYKFTNKESYEAQTPEELWNIISKAENETELNE